MIRLSSIKVPLDTPEQSYAAIAARLLHIHQQDVLSCRVLRRSVDARRKDDVHFVLTLGIEVHGDESSILENSKNKQAVVAGSVPNAVSLLPVRKPPALRPIVVGSGPAGLFAAWTLARAGIPPLLIERGRDAATRRANVDAFWKTGQLDPASNVQFGEGGAGTFSDGKLNTGIKDPRCRDVLLAFAQFGAPEEILWQAKPHIGTDYLVDVVQNMRRDIETRGGEVLFETQLTGLHVENGAIRGAVLNGHTQVETGHILLCIGHSARDTFTMLQNAGVIMEPKPFSIGARIEHPQAMIDKAQYGSFAGHSALGAADYKLSAHLPNGRGVYTFCMCPGGLVVAAASETGGVVTNGMSLFARANENANSALLVDVRPTDFDSDDPLAGMRFQQHWERLAFEAGGGGYRAPAQLAGDFLAGRPSRDFASISPSYRPGTTPSDLRACLPGFVTDSIAVALMQFDRQLKGFANPDAVLTGVETRSSCPLRITRSQQGEASIHGLYPAGEGAGYAGGIMSAAVDGIRAAEHVLSQHQLLEVTI